jgi:hypothetical protein
MILQLKLQNEEASSMITGIEIRNNWGLIEHWECWLLIWKNWAPAHLLLSIPSSLYVLLWLFYSRSKYPILSGMEMLESLDFFCGKEMFIYPQCS